MANKKIITTKSGVKRATVTQPKKPTVDKIDDAAKVMLKVYEPLDNRAKLRLLEMLGVGTEFFTCQRCKRVKPKTAFYISTDPNMQARITNVCKECAEEIAMPTINGVKQETTKESMDDACYILDKPMLDVVWEASVKEMAEGLKGEFAFKSVFSYYMKNIAMAPYYTLTYKNSDGYTGGMLTLDKLESKADTESKEVFEMFEKNKRDTLRLLGYLPFEGEKISEQPFLYSQLIGFLDASEEGNDDMMRVQSIISIVRGFLQASNIDDMIAKLTADSRQAEKNVPIVRGLQSMKKDIMTSVVNLAKENCISLKNSKNSIKGENTWTGKLKRIQELNLRDAQVNGFDIGTCRGMQQVQEISDASIMKQLALDESEWSDMVASMRKTITELRANCDSYKEINRILLQENLDLKDYMEEFNIPIKKNLRNLKELYSVFADEEKDIISEYDEDEEEQD